MRKALFAAAAGLMVFGTVGTAAAQDAFGSDGQIILGADRLWGVNSYKVTTTTKPGGGAPESEDEYKDTQLNFLWGNGGSNPYAIPRLSFDYGVSSGLTVGGSLGYISSSPKYKQTKPVASPEQDGTKTSAFAIAPRVGYALPLGDDLALWPRLGITYVSYKQTSTQGAAGATIESEETNSGFGVNLDAMLVFSPVPGFGLMIGPVIDYTLSGKRETKTTPDQSGGAAQPEVTYKAMNLGLASGLVGYF